MAKRLTLQEKQDCFIKDSINKMFEIAGHSVTFDDISGRTDEWYTEWTMTVEQNDEWKRWGVAEIQKRFKYKKQFAEKEMGMLVLMWGLKFRDFDKNNYFSENIELLSSLVESGKEVIDNMSVKVHNHAKSLIKK